MFTAGISTTLNNLQRTSVRDVYCALFFILKGRIIMNFYPIPSTDGAYEMNKAGVVRNAKTKKKLTPVFHLKLNGKVTSVTIQSLFWEVFGQKKVFGRFRRCPVVAEKNGVRRTFDSLTACSKFIGEKEHYSRHGVMHHLNKREKFVYGWNINYKLLIM